MEQTKLMMQTEEAGEPGKEERQQMVDLGAATVKSSRGTVYILTIIGQIEGHQVLPETAKSTKYEHVLPLLASMEESDEIDGVLILLNTVGGDIEAGLAIAELIAGMKKPTVSLVLGGGHSIGIPLATSTDYSFIAETATMTLHPIRTNGLVITAETTFDYLRRTQERVIDFIEKHSRADRETIVRLMNRTENMPNDVGTILFGHEAVEAGIIDEVGGLSQALRKLRKEIEEKD